MKYEEFTQKVKEGVEKIIRDRIGEGVVVIRSVVKNNDVEMKAISITCKGEKATPTIYLDSYYREYTKGKNIDEISNEVFQMYVRGKDSLEFDIEEFSEFEKIKGKIFYKLINYKMNQKILREIPHFKFLDLAMVFFIMVSCDEQGVASALIHDQHVCGWQITPGELKETACQNTWETYPAVIKRMEDVISEMIMIDIVGENDDSDVIREDMQYGDFDYDEVESVIREEVENLKADKNMDMYVMTNSIRTNGAACIIYPEVLKQFAEENNSDIYIIPSSIHEVILIPGTEWPKEKLDRMIMEVNESELDPVEVLSDHVYIYRREDNEILM